MLELMWTLDRNFVSAILFGFVLAFLPSNVYLMTFSLSKSMEERKKWLILIDSLIEKLATILMLIPMMRLSRWIHTPQRELGRIQALLYSSGSYSDSVFRAKVKLLNLYEKLHSHKRVAFTAGPLGSVTPMAIAELAFAYAAYILIAIRMVARVNNRQQLIK